MRNSLRETPTSGATPTRSRWIPRERALRLIALGAIVALAAALRFANLPALGYVNHYYTAAVRSMLESWHNFFFVSAEPGGSVSVDKPPVGFWLETASAYVFGVNGLGVLLPQILAGILSVVVVYYLVRRSFGTVAGLLAALALTITPIFVATNRNNTIDSTLVLTLLLAAWAFIKATESGKLRYLLLGAALVGIGFNIKMLEAFLPLPAFYALFFLGASTRFWRKIAYLGMATAVLLVVSLSWAVAVDLTPSDVRPFVGSSGDNSVLTLALGYNGVQRLIGMGGMRRGGTDGLLGSIAQIGQNLQSGQAGNGGPGQLATDGNRGSGQAATDGSRGLQQNGLSSGQNGGLPQNATGPAGAFPWLTPGGQGGQGGSVAFGGPGGFGGMDGTGRPGALRLFTAPLSKELSWMLPFGLFGALLLVFRARLRWPIAPKHQAVVLWGGWLLTGAVFFSIAGFFHQYYLSTMAAPLAALVGIAAVETWRIRERHPWTAAALLLLAAAGTLALQLTTAEAFVNAIWWLPLAAGLFVAGAVALGLAAGLQRRHFAVAGFALVVAAMLLTPGIWSGLTTASASENESMPSAYGGRGFGPINDNGGNGGNGGSGLQINQSLLSLLQANTQGMKYLMAVPSSMQGSDYVIATGRPVLYIGGFSGQDPVVTGADLAKLVADGQLRYILWNGNGRGGFGGGFGGQGQSDVGNWVTTQCVPVSSQDTNTQNAGAPDGGNAGRGMQGQLYDCSGAKQ